MISSFVGHRLLCDLCLHIGSIWQVVRKEISQKRDKSNNLFERDVKPCKHRATTISLTALKT